MPKKVHGNSGSKSNPAPATAYCMKCKKKGVKISGAKVVTKANRKMMQGKCSDCGGGVSRMMAKD